MKTINKSSTPMAVTLGKFEAMHLGHASMIEATVEYAKSEGLNSGVLSFVPNPIQVLSDPKYKPLFTEKEMSTLLADSGINYWIPYPFSRELAKKNPRDFCMLLKTGFNCRAILVGQSFRFGHNREGTIETLTTFGRELGMEIITVPYRLAHEAGKPGAAEKISTSQIRAFLSNGKIEEANKLIGRPFFIVGTVQKGRQLGRSIGFPTANLHPAEDKFLPPNGVYKAKVTVGGSTYYGVTNIGTNPTVAEKQAHKAETFIFDFDEDIYGEEIMVELHTFIRPERVFKGLDELKRQIRSDAIKCRAN